MPSTIDPPKAWKGSALLFPLFLGVQPRILGYDENRDRLKKIKENCVFQSFPSKLRISVYRGFFYNFLHLLY